MMTVVGASSMAEVTRTDRRLRTFYRILVVPASYLWTGLLRKRDSLLRLVKILINPGKVFDLTLPLEEVVEGYRAMDERRAIKARMKRKRLPALILTAAMAGVIALGCAAVRGADDSARARVTPSEKTNTVKIRIKVEN
jgi:hypothetical protein